MIDRRLPPPPPGPPPPGDHRPGTAPPPPPPSGSHPVDDGSPDRSGSHPAATHPAPTAPPGVPALDDSERRLAPGAVTVWRLSALLSMGPLGALVTVLAFVLLDQGWLVAAGVLAGLAGAIGWLPAARYRRWRWRVGELALELRSGVLIQQQQAVPYFRIQQIDVVRGPIERLLGLSTLQVTTASASGSALLPGLGAGDAPAVRAELLRRAALAVADHPGDLRDAV